MSEDRMSVSTEYKIGLERRGIALIICNQNFYSEEYERLGSENDRKRLTKTFVDLGFEIHSFKDLEGTEMLKEAHAVARRAAKTDIDCLVVAISSHGDNVAQTPPPEMNTVIDGFKFHEVTETIHGGGKDYSSVDLDKIFDVFSEERCPKLKDKPKLFFIQACRGSKLAETVTIPRQNVSGMTRSEKEQSAGNEGALMSETGLGDSGAKSSDQTTVDAGRWLPKIRLSKRPGKKERDQPAMPERNIDVDGTAATKTSASTMNTQTVQESTVCINTSTSAMSGQAVQESTVYIDEVKLSQQTDETQSEVKTENPTTGCYEHADDPATDLSMVKTTSEMEEGKSSEGKTEIEDRKIMIVETRKATLRRDYLSMHSSPPGYFAFHSSKVSPFIKHLCQVLKERHDTDDLLSMLTEVNLRVATQFKSNFKMDTDEEREKNAAVHERRVVPSIEHQLRKKVYLRTQEASMEQATP